MTETNVRFRTKTNSHVKINIKSDDILAFVRLEVIHTVKLWLTCRSLGCFCDTPVLYAFNISERHFTVPACSYCPIMHLCDQWDPRLCSYRSSAVWCDQTHPPVLSSSHVLQHQSIPSVISDSPVMAGLRQGLCPSVIFVFETEELDLQATTSCGLYPLAFLGSIFQMRRMKDWVSQLCWPWDSTSYFKYA